MHSYDRPALTSNTKYSSVESQKGAINIQRCSAQNQKGAIAAQSICDSALLVLNGTSLTIESALLTLS